MSGTCSQSSFFFTESTCDVASAAACDSNYQCHRCGDWCSSSKGRSVHSRAKHAIFSVGRSFANGRGCCLCCKVTFLSRPRLSAHLTDSRIMKCLAWCVSNATPTESEEIQRLDTIDRDLRSQAWRAGHKQPRSTARAVGQNGRNTGRLAILSLCAETWLCIHVAPSVCAVASSGQRGSDLSHLSVFFS